MPSGKITLLLWVWMLQTQIPYFLSEIIIFKVIFLIKSDFLGMQL